MDAKIYNENIRDLIPNYGPDVLVIDENGVARPPNREECKKMGITFIDWDNPDPENDEDED